MVYYTLIAFAAIRDLMNIQRSFLRYIINLQNHCPISSPLLPPKYSRTLDWITLFLIGTHDNGSQNNQTVKQMTSYSAHESFNEALVRNKEEKQFVLQMVEYPSSQEA